MKFKMWLNEDAWVNLAKTHLGLPNAMSDQDVMNHLKKTATHPNPDPTKPPLTNLDGLRQLILNKSPALSDGLTMFKSYKEIATLLKQIDEECEDQLTEVEEIKQAAAQAQNPWVTKTDHTHDPESIHEMNIKLFQKPNRSVSVSSSAGHACNSALQERCSSSSGWHPTKTFTHARRKAKPIYNRHAKQSL
jgi:hypothetical protein